MERWRLGSMCRREVALLGLDQRECGLRLSDEAPFAAASSSIPTASLLQAAPAPAQWPLLTSSRTAELQVSDDAQSQSLILKPARK